MLHKISFTEFYPFKMIGNSYFEFVVNNNYRGARPGLGGNKWNACVLSSSLSYATCMFHQLSLISFWEKMKILKSFLLYQVLKAQNEPTTTTATTTIETTTTTTTTTATTTVKSTLTGKKDLELPIEVDSRFGFIWPYRPGIFWQTNRFANPCHVEPTSKPIDQWNCRKYSETSCNRTWYKKRRS